MMHIEHLSILIFQAIHVPDWIILDIGSTKNIHKRRKSNKYFLSPYYVKPLLAIIK